MKVDFIIVAFGKSVRFKRDKIAIEIEKNISALELIIREVDALKLFEKIIVVNDTEYLKNKIISTYNKNVIFCRGGLTRAKSVYNGAKLCQGDFLMIHDGARPFIKSSYIKFLYEKIEKDTNIIVPILKISDSLKFIENKKIITKDRDDFFITQTPQIVNRIKFLNLVKKNNEFNWQDELELFSKKYNQCEITFVDGDKKNIKLTNSNDL